MPDNNLNKFLPFGNKPAQRVELDSNTQVPEVKFNYQDNKPVPVSPGVLEAYNKILAIKQKKFDANERLIANSPDKILSISADFKREFDSIKKKDFVSHNFFMHGEDISGIENYGPKITKLLAEVPKLVENKDYNGLYKVYRGIISPPSEGVEFGNKELINKYSNIVSAYANSLKLEQSLKFNPYIKGKSLVKAAMQNPEILVEEGKDILENTYGSPLFGEGMRKAFDENTDSPNRDKINSAAVAAVLSTGKVAKQIEFSELRKKLAKAEVYNVDNPKNKIDTKSLREEVMRVSEELKEFESFNTDAFLEKHYPKLAKEKKLYDAETRARNSGNQEAKLYLSVKSAAKSLANQAIDMGTWALGLFGDESKAQMAGELAKYNRTGYTIGINDKMQPVESSQFYWKDPHGKSHINVFATVESGIPIAAQMLESIALTEVGIGLAGKIGAAGMAAERLSTLAGVFATTYPTMYAQEYNNFKDNKDARNVALFRAGVEGATESWSPNTTKLFTRGVGRAASLTDNAFNAFNNKVQGVFPGITNKAARRLFDSRLAKRSAGIAGDLFQEAVVEEELSLLGNYFVDQYAKTKSPLYVGENDINLDSIMSTAIESTAGMLLTAGFMGGGTKRHDNHAITAARWEIANNPDVYKSLIKNQLENKEITQEEAINRLATIDKYKQELDALPINLGSIRDLKNLLQDKDAQYQYFENSVKRNKLINYVPKDSEREAYEKELASLDKELHKTHELVDKYENLSIADKKEIIATNYKNKLKDILSHQDVSPAILSHLIDSYEEDKAKNPKLFSQELEGFINDLKSEKHDVSKKFFNFLSSNNTQLTYEQVYHKLRLLYLNSEEISENNFEKYEQLLSHQLNNKLTPLFEITDQDQFIDALAKNYVTSEETPLYSEGKLFAPYIRDHYVNNTLFDKLVDENLPEEDKQKRKEFLKEAFWNRVVELKEGKTKEQVFPEVPVEESTEETPTTDNPLIKQYHEAVANNDTEESSKLKSQIKKEISSIQDPKEFLSKYRQATMLFPKGFNIDEAIDEFNNSPTIHEGLKILQGPISISKLKMLFPEKEVSTVKEEPTTIEPKEEVKNKSIEEIFKGGLFDEEGNLVEKTRDEIIERPETIIDKEDREIANNLEEVAKQAKEELRGSELPKLALVDTEKDGTSNLGDKFIARTFALINSIQDLPDLATSEYNLHISANTTERILSRILQDDNMQSIYSYIEGASEPTLEEFTEYFKVNGLTVISQRTIEYFYNNKDKFKDGSVTVVFTNEVGEPLYIAEDGSLQDKNSTGKKAAPIITALAEHEVKNKIVKFVQSKGSTVILPATSVRKGAIGYTALPKGSNIYIASETAEVEEGGKKFTAKAGVAYRINKNAPNAPNENIILKRTDNAKTIIAFIKAYNAFHNGTDTTSLPIELQGLAYLAPEGEKMYPEVLRFIHTYAFMPYKPDNKNIDIEIRFDKATKEFREIVLRKRTLIDGKFVWVKMDLDKESAFIETELSSKYYRNISKHILGGSYPNLQKFPHIKLINGELKVVSQMKYSDFITSPEFGAYVLSEVNRSINYSLPNNLEPKPTERAAEPVATPKIKSIFEIFNSGMSSTTETKKEETKEEKISRLPKPIIDDENTKYSVKAGDRTITKEQNERAKKWLDKSDIFKSTDFIFEQTLTHPFAYATWSRHAITLYVDANFAEAYHEAWHEFTQYYLTPEEKRELYSTALKEFPEITDILELEEKLAEAFRQYALGKEGPTKGLKRIFERIMLFLKNFFNNKKTLDSYFSTLYNGYYSVDKKSNANLYYNELYSSKKININVDIGDGTEALKQLSFKDSENLLKEFDSLFVQAGNALTEDSAASFLNKIFTKEGISQVYNKIYADLYNKLDAAEEYDANLYDILFNFNQIVNFHKKNSLLLSKDVRKEVLDQIEEDAVNNQFSQFDASVNEISQKDFAPEIVINMVRVLPKIEQGEIKISDTTGAPVLGSFDDNWRILQKSLQGSTTYPTMLSRIKKLAKEYKQFESLLRMLPKEVNSQGDMIVKNNFFNLFSQPFVPSVIINVNTSDEFEIKAHLSTNMVTLSLRTDWGNQMAISPGDYKKFNPETSTYNFDLKEFIKDFPKLPKDIVTYLETIGFQFNPVALQKIAQDYETELGLQQAFSRIHRKIKALSEKKDFVGNLLQAVAEKSKGLDSETSSINTLLEYEINTRPELATDMHMNAADDKTYAYNPHTYISKITDVLSNYKDFPTRADVEKELAQLSPDNNIFIQSSVWMNDLFDENGERMLDNGVPRTIQLIRHNGLSIDNDGKKLIKVNPALKLLADIKSFLDPNIRMEEVARFGDKSMTNILRPSHKSNLWEESDFGTIDNPKLPENMFKIFLNYIKTEVDLTNLESVSENFNKNKFAGKSNTPSLGFFFNILEPETRTHIYNVVGGGISDLYNMPDKELLNKIKSEILAYFVGVRTKGKSRVQVTREIINPILGNNYEEWGFDPKNINRELLKYHLLSFISRMEQYKIFFSHPYYYKDVKDIEKRLSAWNASGIFPVIDKDNAALSSNYQGEEYYKRYADSQGIKVLPRIANHDQLQYLVFEDNQVISKTALKFKDQYEEHLGSYTDSNSKREDAAAIMTLDFYKKFYSLSTGWTFPMQQEYNRQMKIWNLLLLKKSNTRLDIVERYLDKLLNTKPYFQFNIKKLQYAGFGKIGNEFLPVFHKYSVATILPSIAAIDDSVFDILSKLHASSVDYGVFESGTKIAETTVPVPLFEKGTKKVIPSAEQAGIIELKYLKEQQLVENKETTLSLFATQFRKLAFRDMTTDKETDLFNLYNKYINELVNYDKARFLDTVDNKKRFAELLIKELSKKDVSESTKDFIKLKREGDLQYVLDSFIERTLLEQTVVATVKNNIIKQKYNGTQLVQFPVSLMRPDIELVTYHKDKDGNISPAECVYQFSKKFYSLLRLIGEPLDENGEPVTPYTSLKALNAALKNKEFVKENIEALTIAGVRIPTQGPNSMEHFVIKEFLPEEVGQIILVPDEMVVKSGSDYDIDKLFMYETVLNNLGKPVIYDEPMAKLSNIDAQIADINNQIDLIKKAFADTKYIKEDLTELDNEIRDLVDEMMEIQEQIENSSPIELSKSSKKFTSFEELGKVTIDPELLESKDELTSDIKDAKKEKATLIKEVARIYQPFFDELNLALKTGEKVNGRALKDHKEKLIALIEELNAEKRIMRDAMQNNVISTLKQRLSQEEIFNDLIEPNNTKTIEELNEIFGQNFETDRDGRKRYDFVAKYHGNNISNWSNALNPNYQNYVFGLNGYKSSLGIDAKNNTFQALAQQAKLRLENESSNRKYILPANRDEDGNVIFYGVYDQSKERKISNIISQMISGHVDIMKDDSIARIRLNNIATPVALYMNLAGTSFETIVALLNSEAVVRYLKGEDAYDVFMHIMNTASLSDRASLNNYFKEVKETPTKDYQKKKAATSIASYAVNSIVAEEKVRQFVVSLNKYDGSKEETPQEQFHRFALFIEMLNQAKELSDLSRAVDYDTLSPQNFESYYKRQSEVDRIKHSKIFNPEAVEYLNSHSIVSGYNIDSPIISRFEKMFPITVNKRITDHIVTRYNKFANSSTVDFDSFSRKFKNALLTSLWMTKLPEPRTYVKYMKIYPEGSQEENAALMYKRLVEKYPDFDNVVFKDIVINASPDSQYLSLGLRTPDLTYSIDTYKEDFKAGLNSEIDEISEFFRIFANIGIISTQLNKTRNSYNHIIPEELYTPYMEKIIADFGEELSQETSSSEVIEEKIKHYIQSHELTGKTQEELETEAINSFANYNESRNFMEAFLQRFTSNNPQLFRGYSGKMPASFTFYKNYNLEDIPTLKEEKPKVSIENIFKAGIAKRETPKESGDSKVDTSKKINIYAGTNENKELSNLADRHFTIEDTGEEYSSVEAAYQAAKIAYAKNSTKNAEIAKKLGSSINGFEAKKLGSQIEGLEVSKWDKDSSKIMKELLLQSFKQNPEALEKLLATGNAELTHTQEKGKWGREFPKLLMEVREELAPAKPVEPTKKTPSIENIFKLSFTTSELDEEGKTNKDNC